MAFYDEDIMPGRGIQRAGIIATDDDEEIERAARLAEERRIRANVLEEALARAPETDAAATIVNRRGADGVSRLYTVDGGGQIVSPTNRERPFSEDEWAALDRAVAARDRAALGDLYSPERRTQGLGYAASGLLDEAELRRRREEAFGPKGTESIAQSARAAKIRSFFAHERAYGNGPSAKQQEVKKRWDAERAARSRYPNERNARMAMAEASRASAERQAQLNADTQLALAQQQGLDAKAIAEINQKGTLSLEQLRSMNQRQLQELINKGNLSVAQEQGKTQRAVAEAEGMSRVKAAEATASGVRDAGLAKAQADAEAQRQEAQKRGMELLGLAQRLANGGRDPDTLMMMDAMVDNQKDLSPSEKVRRKEEFRKGNMAFMYDFLVRQAGDAFAAAGYGGLPVGSGGTWSVTGAQPVTAPMPMAPDRTNPEAVGSKKMKGGPIVIE